MRLFELRIERPKSDKNFPRNIMPQIRKGDIEDSPFDYTKHNVDIETLMPVQNQRVKGMHDRAKRGFADGTIRPIVIDKNNYIVNGHHRFDIALEMGIKKLDVLKVNATIEELIEYFSGTSSDAATFEAYIKEKLSKTMENFADGKKKDKMTGNEMRELLDKKHAWDDGIHNPEFINDVRRHNWVLINNYPLAKLGSVEDPYDRIIDPDDDYAMRDSDLSEPIVIAPDRKSVMDGNHRVHKAREMGKTHLPAYFPMIDENFADGKKKGKSKPGRVKKAGASCKGSVTSLRAKAKKYSGERGKMYHWCANMKSGKK